MTKINSSFVVAISWFKLQLFLPIPTPCSISIVMLSFPKSDCPKAGLHPNALSFDQGRTNNHVFEPCFSSKSTA
jgi:hypothetical protein